MSEFDHDRLEAYRLARALNVEIAKLLAEVPPGRHDLADQLRRAATSISLNTAEGAGEFSPREKARFYRIARRSTTELAAALDSLVDHGFVRQERVAGPRDIARRVIGALIGLIRVFSEEGEDSPGRGRGRGARGRGARGQGTGQGKG